MSAGFSERYERLRREVEACGQGHLLAFWSELGSEQRELLLEDIGRINLAEIPSLVRIVKTQGGEHAVAGRLEPAPVVARDSISADVAAYGAELLSGGRVAALTVAGGQGTRLGFPGPKGAFPISPVRNKTLFQLFAETVRATDRRYGCRTPWYVMTSPVNDAETQAFFRQHGHFGLDAEQITFFQQGVMPAFDRSGKILLEHKHRVALAPDGHGGSLLAMCAQGVLADMAERGVEQISYFQVDNPLVACLDPVFLGLHGREDSEMSSKTLPKADDLERVGNFVLADGKLTVIEYSDLPEKFARARNADGSRRFDAANIAVHALSRSFVERLTADRAAFALPWHRAEKKVPYVDVQTGERIEPEKPNAVKLEAFIFDALPLAERPMLLETSRAEEFSPVKNATGVDSVETARRDMSRRAARWLEGAGAVVPRTADGEPDGMFEISPLLALDAEDPKLRGPGGHQVVKGGKNYFE